MSPPQPKSKQGHQDHALYCVICGTVLVEGPLRLSFEKARQHFHMILVCDRDMPLLTKGTLADPSMRGR